jgi:hypothetical protein
MSDNEESDVVTEDDKDPANILFRAGFLRSLARKLDGEDRKFVLRAARSLRAYAMTFRSQDTE